MTLYPYFIQKRQVANTAELFAKQYKTFSDMYGEPFEHHPEVFASIVHYRYHLKKNKTNEQALLPLCPKMIDLKELVIEVLDKESGFNKLPLPRQVALENVIEEVLEEAGILF